MWDASDHGTSLCEGLTSDLMKGRWKANSVNEIKPLKENQSYMWLMSFGIDWVAGMLRRLSRQQLICFSTGVQLEWDRLIRLWSSSACELYNCETRVIKANYVATYRQNPVSEQWSQARTSDDFSIFQTGCSTEDNRLSIYERATEKCFQLKTIFIESQK